MIFFIAHTKRNKGRTSIGMVEKMSEIDKNYAIDLTYLFDTPRLAYEFLVAARARLSSLNYTSLIDNWDVDSKKCVQIIQTLYGELYDV